MPKPLESQAVIESAQLPSSLIYPDDHSPGEPRPGHLLGRSMLLVAWGIFVSTMGQTFPGNVADLPLRGLLQERVGTLRMAWFFTISMSPWYFKPIAGLFSDAFPILGTRRKSYMILGALAGSAMWLLLGAVPRTYHAMLAAAFAMNVALVIVSSSTAGLLVEDGQRLGATGRLTSTRMVVQSLSVVLGGVLGGFFAQRHLFGAMSVTIAAAIFSLVLIVWPLLDEPKVSVPGAEVLRRGWRQIKVLACSGTMWAAAGMMFLINVSPGFQSPLYEHLTKDLSYSPQFIGRMQSSGGACAVAGALIYAWLCRRVNLRKLLVLSLLAAAAGVLPYLNLHSHAVGVIAYCTSGFGAALAALAGLDLATRASPRGVEAMGYSLIVSDYNISLNCSDVWGSWLWDRLGHHFDPLVAINAGTTVLVLLAVPFLPRALVQSREGGRAVE